MAIEIVNLLIENGDFPQFFVCLPEDILIPMTANCHKMALGFPRSPRKIWPKSCEACAGDGMEVLW